MSDENIPIHQQAEFIRFLAHTYKGKLSGKPLTAKVISDNVGRIKRIERILGLKIQEATMTAVAFDALKCRIKQEDSLLRTSSVKNPYGYGGYIYAAHLYHIYMNHTEEKSFNQNRMLKNKTKKRNHE